MLLCRDVRIMSGFQYSDYLEGSCCGVPGDYCFTKSVLTRLFQAVMQRIRKSPNLDDKHDRFLQERFGPGLTTECIPFGLWLVWEDERDRQRPMSQKRPSADKVKSFSPCPMWGHMGASQNSAPPKQLVSFWFYLHSNQRVSAILRNSRMEKPVLVQGLIPHSF